ncbi:MAG: hypothetical protein JST04_11145 [Bdellovibrionales bacterium]|nr:hypothetical protein [Bdellovibrionales bacterium]
MGNRLLRPTSTKFVSASFLAALVGGLSSCAVLQPNVIEPTADAPAPPAAVEAPGYAGVPHPLGLQIGDVAALFATPGAPKRGSDEMKTCAADYDALAKATKAKDELKQGLLELVRKEPIRYHWCFYSKILDLEEKLRGAQMLDDRQRAVVEAYRFLAPLSRVFYREFHDSRYLRWAVSYYRRASELAFYRRVETSPGLTQELVGAGGDETTRGITEKATSVLEKYGIIVPERLQPGQSPDEIPKGDALPSDAYVNTGSGVLDSTATGSEAKPGAGAEDPTASTAASNPPAAAPDSVVPDAPAETSRAPAAESSFPALTNPLQGE